MDSTNFKYLFFGFTVAWVIPVIYVVTLINREKRIREEMTRLKQMVEGGAKK